VGRRAFSEMRDVDPAFQDPAGGTTREDIDCSVTLAETPACTGRQRQRSLHNAHEEAAASDDDERLASMADRKFFQAGEDALCTLHSSGAADRLALTRDCLQLSADQAHKSSARAIFGISFSIASG